MKKNLFKLLPVLLLGLTACNGGSNDSSNSGDLPEEKEATIVFYLDYNHADEDNPYFEASWYLGVPFEIDDLEDEEGNKLVEPTAKDANYPEFTKFKGWSMHPVIDNDDQLWKFGVDVKEKDDRGTYLQLFGIWVETKQ